MLQPYLYKNLLYIALSLNRRGGVQRVFFILSAEKSEFAQNSFFFTLREYITPIPERGSIADNTRGIEDSPLLIQREQSEAPANETG